MIDEYAKAFAMDPDLVYKKDFNTVTYFLILWKENREFNDRWAEATKAV